MTTSGSSKNAEKSYLERSGTEPWERTKPFAVPGHDDVEEGARLIHDFAVALLCLRPRPGQVVLDLGSGSCWASEWLQRFNVDTVSVDISVDMLRIGRARLPRTRRVVAGDLERLPLGDASVDAAVCFNAFHHLPDGASALDEIRRVLRPGGRVLFSEPGAGHAAASTSRKAADAFGVLEQDIVLSDFLAACRRAGFGEVHVTPVAHVVPWFRITEERWRRWDAVARSRRPRRALRKMWHAALEGLGVAKDGTNFEDALGIELVRILQGAVAHHPTVLASKAG